MRISPPVNLKHDQPPQPLRGANGFLSSRIEMSNGDIVYRKHVSVWAQHTFVPLTIILVALASLALSAALVHPDLAHHRHAYRIRLAADRLPRLLLDGLGLAQRPLHHFR